MTGEILEKLQQITPEEQRILSGEKTIEKEIYMEENSNVIDATKLLEAGKLIQVRTHTRFIHFPEHTHNYVEMIYMCSGSTHHVINGEDVILKQGELLILNQNAVQEIYPAGEGDVAVNFIILPEFFDRSVSMIEQENILRDFLLSALSGSTSLYSYLHFSAKFIIQVLSYVEEHYKSGELTELAEELRFDIYWLSKEIRKRTGKTYTDLVQAKRLSQAAYLLRTTAMNVMDISMAVGYDNISYFHRIFQKKYGMTPRRYRISE